LDVITADIIQPVHAGAGSLYSAEYFTLARNALNDDGLMLQWIGLRSETQYKLILRTFLSVFPEATLWADGSLVVGTKHPLQLDPADFARKQQQPPLSRFFKRLECGIFSRCCLFTEQARRSYISSSAQAHSSPTTDPR
jgi:hypothetical protein